MCKTSLPGHGLVHFRRCYVCNARRALCLICHLVKCTHKQETISHFNPHFLDILDRDRHGGRESGPGTSIFRTMCKCTKIS